MSKSNNEVQDAELLVQRYIERPSADLRDLILVQFTGTVGRTARRFAGVEAFEDLVQVGYIGLLNALKKYDPNAGVRFSTYATHLIAGEIKHYLRDKAQMIRQPAWLQEMRHKINRAQVQLQATLGRVPTHSEVSLECGVSVAMIEEVLATNELTKVTSFDATLPGEEDGNELDNLAGLDPDQLSVEERVVLESAIEQLRDLEREVLVRFHFDSMSQTEIAQELGISCNYVSHILRQSLNKLRRILTSEESSDRSLRKGDAKKSESSIDSALGIYSVKYFNERLEEEVHRAQATNGELSILLVKFSGLQAFSSFYGRESVTDLMADAAENLKTMIRCLDILCRDEKDGFAIILPFTGLTCHLVQERILERFGPWLNNRRSPIGTVGIQVSCATLDDKTKTARQMTKAARAGLVPEVIESQAA